MPRIGTVIREVDHRPGGVLWIRVLWLSAWQCWLACVSARPGFYPRREYIAALAAALRAHAGRPA